MRISEYDYLNTSDDPKTGELSSFSVKPSNITIPANCKPQSIAVGKDMIVYLTSSNTLFLYDRRNANKTTEGKTFVRVTARRDADKLN